MEFSETVFGFLSSQIQRFMYINKDSTLLQLMPDNRSFLKKLLKNLTN